MDDNRLPLVSIGVPVFNGEAGLARSLDSLLQQDYANLEIVISDNASTDATARIAEDYARHDSRVKYTRTERNHGAAWNFSRVFELSSGKYFMWAAHDDEREPRFVSACVGRLEAEPDAVLCQTYTEVSVEGDRRTIYVAHLGSFARAISVVSRYREALSHLPATAIYGLYRSSAVRATQLWENVVATDIAFVQEVSIHGRFIEVPEVLFKYRGRASWNTIDQDARFFLGVPAKPWWYLPFAVLFLNHASRVRRAPIPVSLKIRLWLVLLWHEATQVAIRLVLKLAGALCPAAKRESLGRVLYCRWLQNPNLEVLSDDLFLQRVCKPQLGWWR